VTKESEPKTTSYAWFTSTGDNTEVPNNWVRGFEVYEDESALVEVHRSSTPYKKMRSSVVPEKILEKPTDLRFLRPTGYGFMTRRSSSCNFDGKILQNDEKSLVKIMEIKPLEKTMAEMLTEIQMLAGHVEQFEATTASFWVLEYLPEYSEDTVVIFLRFKNTMACQAHQDSDFVSNSM
jgi:quinol monooxygenase YgiN